MSASDSGSGGLSADDLTDGSRLRGRKIVTSVLSALVVTIGGVYLNIIEVFVTWQARFIRGLGEFIAAILRTFTLEAQATAVSAWITAQSEAVALSPVLAPLLLVGELLLIIAIASAFLDEVPVLSEVP